MPKFRKKPVVLEAQQWSGHPTSVSPDWAEMIEYGPQGYAIPTLEGRMLVSPGDWIIKGIKGEFYPCKPDIFATLYEPVNESVYDGDKY